MGGMADLEIILHSKNFIYSDIRGFFWCYSAVLKQCMMYSVFCLSTVPRETDIKQAVRRHRQRLQKCLFFDCLRVTNV